MLRANQELRVQKQEVMRLDATRERGTADDDETTIG